MAFTWKLVESKAEPGFVVAPDERLSWPRTVGIGVQHVMAMFGATVLVPALTGMPATTALLFSGVGTLLFLLLAETLAQDWNLPQIRLINASLGVGVALLIATLMHLLHLLLARRSRRKAQLAAAQRTDEQTTSRS